MGTSKNDVAGVNSDVPCGLPYSGQVWRPGFPGFPVSRRAYFPV